MKIRIALGALLASVASVALATTFNLFSPATGILKGSSSTYITSAAASIDIRALWSGTCNSTTFLRGDGSCVTPGGSGGTVTSVGLTMPTGFSVGGSPVTTTGTLAITTTLNGPLRGNGSGFLTGNLALGSEVSGTLPVANGGIGVGTLTGIAKGNGTSAFTAAVSANVISLWTGTCDSTTFLRADGSCQAAGGGGGGSVTSVALIVPTGLSVTGSPVTTSGTLGITTALSGPVRGNGSGFTTGATALGSEVSGTLPVANGGSGAATLTGPLKGNGTSAFTAAASADIIGLWSGTCNSSALLRGDGACAAIPTGTVSSVAITMPGIFSVGGSPITTSGTLAITASGTSGGIPFFDSTTTLASSVILTNNRIVLGGGAGASPKVVASNGTTTTLLHGDAAGAPTFGAVSLTADVSGTLPAANGGTGVTSATGTGSVVLSVSPAFTGSPTVGGQNICRADGTGCPGGSVAETTANGSGLTVTGCTSGTASYRYTKVGSMVILTIPDFQCTSNATTHTITGLPAAITPAGAGGFTHIDGCRDNGAAVNGCSANVGATTLTFRLNNSTSGWTASGTWRIGEGGDAQVVYSILD